jgi:tetratricopeptide (TPR) repeat protein
MSTPKFSVVVIARNAEKTITRLLDSLAEFRGWGGEIVLVDTGSTDDTAKIARDYGCFVTEVGTKFLHEISGAEATRINQEFVQANEPDIVKPGAKIFNFAEARNYAASLAKNDMVFAIDSDEYFSKLDIEFINGAIDANMEQVSYVYVHSHRTDGTPDITFDRCHLYDRRKIKWTGIIHETLTGFTDRNYRVSEDRLKVEHRQNLETDRSGYLVGLALDCFLNPGNDRNCHYFGRELFWSGRYHSAIHELCRHVAMDKWVTERAQSMVFIGDCWEKLGKGAQASYWWHRACDEDPTRREAFLRFARFYYGKGAALQTAIYAQAALQIPQPSVMYYADSLTEYREYPHELLCWALWRLGKKDDARFHWTKALNYAPDCERIKGNAKFFQ